MMTPELNARIAEMEMTLRRSHREPSTTRKENHR